MRLYLDSANTQDWDRLMPYGVFHGITTNPLLADRSGWKYSSADWDIYLTKANQLGAKELHIQLYGSPDSFKSQVEHLLALKKKHELELDIVIKIPLKPDAIKRVAEIQALNVKILMTACYSSKQALIATNLGAQYLAPYLGRMKNLGLDVDKEVEQMLKICNAGNCELMAASLRSVEQLVELAALGIPAATISADLADEMMVDENSLKAAKDFDDIA